jgi:hypothetical protein
MADEAFALSPISARAALPSEQDYDAIREAFMETSRGRWFLGEYAKRNRNADTTMVLDAVARIEQAMAAQKQEPVRNDDELRAALAAIRHAVDEAAGKASSALTGLELAEKLSPIHKGARIIKEISWRWREIGADGRICDLIDSQLAAIEASCTEISKIDSGAALEAAFDLLRHRIDEIDEGKETAAKVNGRASPHATGTSAPEVMVAPAPARAPEPTAKQTAEAGAVAIGQPSVETAFAEPELPAETTTAEPVIIEPEPEPIEAAAKVAVTPEPLSPQAVVARDELVQGELVQDEPVGDVLAQGEFADSVAEGLADDLAQDEAVLEMVAIEMAAPDDSVDDFLPEEDIVEAHATLPPVAAPVVERTPAPAPAPRLEVAPPPPPSRLEMAPPPPPPPQFLPERAPPVAPEPSLGSSLLASGILQRPKAPASDPLAPIRRMSQAEKVAFFS